MCMLLTAFATCRAARAVQAVQADQWKTERQDLDMKAATWCQDQIQSVRKEAEQAVAAAESKCESWCAAKLRMQAVASTPIYSPGLTCMCSSSYTVLGPRLSYSGRVAIVDLDYSL